MPNALEGPVTTQSTLLRIDSFLTTWQDLDVATIRVDALRARVTAALLAAYIGSVVLNGALIVGVSLGVFHLADRWVGVLLAGTAVNPTFLLLVLKFWFPTTPPAEAVKSARQIEPRRRTESPMSERYLGSLEQLVLMAVL